MDKLKPCPFCGTKAHFIEKDKQWDVGCYTDDCYLRFGAEWCMETKEEIAELWNNRIPILLTDVEKTSSYDEV